MGIFQSGFFSTTKVAIGQLLYGGVVYYIDNNYFYIVKESQLGTGGNLFPCASYNWIGTSSAIGTSASNTNIIKTACPTSTVVINAQSYSVTMDGVVYDDWEVPSSGDLRAIYDNLVTGNKSTFQWIPFGTQLVTSSTSLGFATIQYFNYAGVEIQSLNASGNWRIFPVRKQLR